MADSARQQRAAREPALAGVSEGCLGYAEGPEGRSEGGYEAGMTATGPQTANSGQ